MKKYKYLLFCVSFSLLLFIPEVDSAAYTLYECPNGWYEHFDHCYKFVPHPEVTRDASKTECQKDGASVLSVNDQDEHNFIVNTLGQVDGGSLKRNWWTSGVRQSTGNMTMFFWEGDGTKVENFYAWHNGSIIGWKDKDFIIYYYDGTKWGWILDQAHVTIPFICEISKEDIYKITTEERGPDYGVSNPDPETIPRGPSFVEQPSDIIHEQNDVTGAAYIQCIADAYPSPDYEWWKERAGVKEQIDAQADPRYTLVNGQLIIHQPAASRNDDGNYQCASTNDYGKIMSGIVSLSFGYLQDFPKSPRSDVTRMSHQWASVECSPPPHYPDVLYTWYKNDIYNFIRPELKPYTFISYDGRLYFSEVTTDDIGEYFCMIYKPGQALAEGKVSMPTKLSIVEGSPGEYEPEIRSGFPLVYPSGPQVGMNVRVECWASGTSNPPLIYNWDKVNVDETGTVIGSSLPWPPNAAMSDHNRVVTIQNIQPYEAGHYRCTVQRQHGQTVQKTVEVILQAKPYFILALKDMFVDYGSNLEWRCSAGGNPSVTYMWLKNGVIMNNDSIPQEDLISGRVEIRNTVLVIKNLDDTKDNGMYQCAARNTHAITYSSGELRVLSFPPTFAKYPLQPNQVATVSGNTTLLCRPEAAPVPLADDIVWYKNKAPLNPGTEEGARVRKMPNGNLFINNVRTSDGGVYMCRVTNALGTAETTGNLTILRQTTITLPPIDRVVPLNRTAFLPCMASYNPAMDVTYTWFHGDVLIVFERIFHTGESKYEIWYHPFFRRGRGIYNGGLYIMNAQFEEAGFYTCIVESPADRYHATARVDVVGPPAEPAGVFHDPSSVKTTSVVLNWKAGGSSGSPITSYVIEGFNSYEGFWRILRTNVPGTGSEQNPHATMSANVTNLRPNSKYVIRMRAENKYGTSIPSIPSESFQTGPVRPDKYPKEVGGGGGKVGVVSVTWMTLDPWDQGSSGIGYTVYIKQKNDEDWEYTVTVNGNYGNHTQLVGEVHYYKPYLVAVQAFNSLGSGPVSPIVEIMSSMALPAAMPEDVRAQPFNSTACLVHWISVQDTRDHVKGKLGGYRLSFWKEGVETREDALSRTTIEGQATEGMVISLEADTAYYFDVMVWNEAGNGPPSQYYLQRTLRRAPMNPPVEVKLTRISSWSVSVWWRGVSTNQLEEPLEGYKVRIWREGKDIKASTDYDARKETELLVEGLRPDILYKLRVFGYSRGGDGVMSSPTMRFILGAAGHVQLSIITICISFLVSIVFTNR